MLHSFSTLNTFGFLGPSPRWDFWSLGLSGAGLEAPGAGVGHCLGYARDWQPLPGWDTGSGAGLYGAEPDCIFPHTHVMF